MTTSGQPGTTTTTTAPSTPTTPTTTPTPPVDPGCLPVDEAPAEGEAPDDGEQALAPVLTEVADARHLD